MKRKEFDMLIEKIAEILVKYPKSSEYEEGYGYRLSPDWVGKNGLKTEGAPWQRVRKASTIQAARRNNQRLDALREQCENEFDALWCFAVPRPALFSMAAHVESGEDPETVARQAACVVLSLDYESWRIITVADREGNRWMAHGYGVVPAMWVTPWPNGQGEAILPVAMAVNSRG